MSRSNITHFDPDHVSMEMSEWWPWYRRITRSFGYSREQDQRATDLLTQLLVDLASPISEFVKLLNGRRVIVFGAGPSLETDLTKLVELDLIGQFTTIAADGATSAFLGVANSPPDIIVSDLDGPLRDLMSAVANGSRIVIHAHGDNMTLLKSSVHSFSKALGTTQVEPRRNVYNFGGFTDGDRAVFLARAMHASTIVLAGMDFGKEIGKYSKLKVEYPKVKVRKLRIGKSLLQWLAERRESEYFNITSNGERIAGFRRVEPDQL